MQIEESRYVLSIISSSQQSSLLKGSTFLCSGLQTGIHNTLLVKSLLAPLNPGAVIDLLYRFELPYISYVDVHELESRHEFPWQFVNIHVYSDNVDYESIDRGDSRRGMRIGIEFIGVSLDRLSLVGDAYEWSFELPVHLRYRIASQHRNESLGIVVVELPSLFVKVYPVENQNCMTDDFCIPDTSSTSLQSPVNFKRYKRYYDVTFLGGEGNSGVLHYAVETGPDVVNHAIRYEVPQELLSNPIIDSHLSGCSKQVVWSMPLGNTHDLALVLTTTTLIICLTTVSLLLLMAKKLWRRT